MDAASRCEGMIPMGWASSGERSQASKVRVSGDTWCAQYSQRLDEALNRADRVSADILGASSAVSAERPVLSHYHCHHHCHSYHPYGWGGWFWGGPSVTVIHEVHGSARQEREARKSALMILAGVAFGTIAVISAYFVGRDIGLIGEANEALDAAKRDRRALERGALLDYHTENKFRNLAHRHLEVEEVVAREESLLRSVKRRAVLGLALKVGALALATLGVVGALLGAAPVVAAAAAASLVVFSAMLIKAGVESSSHRLEREARALQAEIRRMRG